MKALLLLFTASLVSIFRAPDEGGDTGGGDEPKTVQDIARENAELSERCAAAGIDVPAFPAGPAGLERAREYMRTALKEKDENDAKPKDVSALEGDDLRAVAEEEDADVNDEMSDDEVRAAIEENRKAKEQAADPNAGESGSGQSGDPNA